MAEEQVKRRYDIVNGVRVFAVPPTLRHQRILGHLLSPFGDYADHHGYVTLFSLFDVQISREPFCTRHPDVLLVSQARMQTHMDGEPLSIAPDLVVEIMSSIDRELALENKLRDHRAIGVQECRIVRPESASVEIASLDGEKFAVVQTYGEGQKVCSLICSGLQVLVNEVLQD